MLAGISKERSAKRISLGRKPNANAPTFDGIRLPLTQVPGLVTLGVTVTASFVSERLLTPVCTKTATPRVVTLPLAVRSADSSVSQAPAQI